MKRALVLGGTRFFGKRLVLKLIDNGWDVTIASRGMAADPFEHRVSRIIVDRYNTASLQAGLSTGDWDVVFDQICYAPSDALDTLQILSGRIGRYVLTSTGSVYKNVPMPYREKHFDPYIYPVRMGRRGDFEYGEGKRLAEAVLFQQAAFPVVAMRIPVAVGPDDYTQRLAGLVRCVQQGKVMKPLNMERQIGFISSQEAADFLYWLALAPITGPYNAAATGSLTMQGLLSLIEGVTGGKALFSPEAEQDAPLQGSSHLDNRQAQEAGFVFTNLLDWLPELIAELKTR